MILVSRFKIGLHRDGQNWGLETVEVDERRRCLWEVSIVRYPHRLSASQPMLREP